MRGLSILSQAALLPAAVLACGGDAGHDGHDGHDHDSCFGPANKLHHVRHVPRMQPGSEDAPSGPTKELEFGQLNMVLTTDTHGWLESHIKEPTYSADWGDYRSFVKHMKDKADKLDVDLLLIDSGDLHDGTGLSDATLPDGTDSMPIYDAVPFDLMCIGNHELYLADVSNDMYFNWAKKWGDRYVTSNVQAWNQTTQQYEYIGAQSRYWTTPHGLRIKAWCVLYDFKGNSNSSKVIPASEMVQQQWFIDDVNNADEPVDVFILGGHNPVRETDPASTIKVAHDVVRAAHPHIPILVPGGHTHIRDFVVYDNASVGLEAGRYCETVGFLSMSGFDCNNSGWTGKDNPKGVPNPSRPATPSSPYPWVWARRYLDFNRKTFLFHTKTTQHDFDTPEGVKVTGQITKVRQGLDLDQVLGCVPQDYCTTCAPFNDTSKNIFPAVLSPALSAVVVNEDRKDKPRYYTVHTGSVRFDLHKGQYTKDDNFVVAPFRNVFVYLQDVPWTLLQDILGKLNSGPVFKKRSDMAAMPELDSCLDPLVKGLTTRDLEQHEIVRRQETLTPGYNTTDDWGNDGDDTKHSSIPSFPIPHFFDSRANFPESGVPDVVDYVFVDFFQAEAVGFLGSNYTVDMVKPYISANFTLQDYLGPFAEMTWQANKDNCPT